MPSAAGTATFGGGDAVTDPNSTTGGEAAGTPAAAGAAATGPDPVTVATVAGSCAAGTLDELPSIAFTYPDARAVWPQELRTFETLLLAAVNARLDETIGPDSATKLGEARSALRKAIVDFDDGGAALAQSVAELAAERDAVLGKVGQTANGFLTSFEQAADRQLRAHDEVCGKATDDVLRAFDKIAASILALDGLAGDNKTSIESGLAALRSKIEQQVRPLCVAASQEQRASYLGDYDSLVATLHADLDATRDGSIAKRIQVEFDSAIGKIRERRDSLIACARSLLEKLPAIPDLPTDNAGLRSAAMESYRLSIADKLNDWYWDTQCTKSGIARRTAVSAAAPCGETETTSPPSEAAASLAKLAAVTTLSESQHQSLRDRLNRSWTTYVRPTSAIRPFNEGVGALVDNGGSFSSPVQSLQDLLAFVKGSNLDLSPNETARNERLYDSLNYLKSGSLDLSPSETARDERLYDSLNYLKDSSLDLSPSETARDERLYDALNYLKSGSLDLSPSETARNERLYDSLNYLKGNFLDLSPSETARNERLYDCIGVTLKQTTPGITVCLGLTQKVEATLSSVVQRYAATRTKVQEKTRGLVGLRGLHANWGATTDRMGTAIQAFPAVHVASYGASAPTSLYQRGLSASLPLRNGSALELRSAWVRRWAGDASEWLTVVFAEQGL